MQRLDEKIPIHGASLQQHIRHRQFLISNPRAKSYPRWKDRPPEDRSGQAGYRDTPCAARFPVWLPPCLPAIVLKATTALAFVLPPPPPAPGLPGAAPSALFCLEPQVVGKSGWEGTSG